jgi:hypothetical protein
MFEDTLNWSGVRLMLHWRFRSVFASSFSRAGHMIASFFLGGRLRLDGGRLRLCGLCCWVWPVVELAMQLARVEVLYELLQQAWRVEFCTEVVWEDEHVLERVDREQRKVIHALAEVVQRVREAVSVRSQEVYAISLALELPGARVLEALLDLVAIARVVEQEAAML